MVKQILQINPLKCIMRARMLARRPAMLVLTEITLGGLHDGSSLGIHYDASAGCAHLDHSNGGKRAVICTLRTPDTG